MKLNLQAAIDGKLDEQLNLALCEWLGWTRIENMRFHRAVGLPPGKVSSAPSFTFSDSDDGWKTIPNHITAPESLGLVHEVEKLITNPGDRENYVWWLNHLHPKADIHGTHNLRELRVEIFLITTATARQRVIAILQTVKPEIFE